MQERDGLVTLKQTPVTLLGQPVDVGMTAPEANLVNGNLEAVALSGFRDRVCVLLAVPSLDTPVCDAEARRFNQEAAALGADVNVLVISMDLPFAQQRWCGAAGVENVTALSDHRDADFGTSYGVLIKGLRLLARALFVIDRDGRVTYTQIVPEVADEPDYDAALNAVGAAL